MTSGDDPLPVDLGEGVTLRRYTMDDLGTIWAVVPSNTWGCTGRSSVPGVGNVRSRAVPERLGYRQEGLEVGGGKGLGGYYDMVVYAMVEEEWRERSR